EGLALLHGFQGLFRAHRFGFGVQQPLRHAVRAPFFVFFTARRLHPNAPGTADAPGARTLAFYRLPKFVSRKRTVSYRDPLEPALPPAESSSPSAAGSSSAPLRAAGSPSSSPSISDRKGRSSKSRVMSGSSSSSAAPPSATAVPVRPAA